MKLIAILISLCFPVASFAAYSNATKFQNHSLVKVNEFLESKVNFYGNGPTDPLRWIGRLHTPAGDLNALLINSCYILTYSEACHDNMATCQGTFEAVEKPHPNGTPATFMYSSPAKVVAYGDIRKGEPNFMVLELPRDKTTKKCLGDNVGAFAPIKPLGNDRNLENRLVMAGYRDQNDHGLRVEMGCSGEVSDGGVLFENCSARHGQSASAIMLQDTEEVIALMVRGRNLPGKVTRKLKSNWDEAVLVDSFYPLIQKYLPKRNPNMAGNQPSGSQTLASR